MQKEAYHENQQNEIFKIRDEQNILWNDHWLTKIECSHGFFQQ